MTEGGAAVVLPIPIEWVSALIETRYELDSPITVFAAGLDSEMTSILIAFRVDGDDLSKLDIIEDVLLHPGDESSLN